MQFNALPCSRTMRNMKLSFCDELIDLLIDSNAVAVDNFVATNVGTNETMLVHEEIKSEEAKEDTEKQHSREQKHGPHATGSFALHSPVGSILELARSFKVLLQVKC